MATYGQTRKRVGSWWLWIAADVVYIPLYAYKNLYLDQRPLRGVPGALRHGAARLAAGGGRVTFAHGLVIEEVLSAARRPPPPHRHGGGAVRALVTVVVAANAVETIPLADRAAWLREAIRSPTW